MHHPKVPPSREPSLDDNSTRTQLVSADHLFVTQVHELPPSDELLADEDLPREWGEYDQVTLVAEGGMGRVYKARNRRLNRPEALKVIRRMTGDEREMFRFLFEAEAVAGLNHPNLIKVYGSGEVKGGPYFAMQWVDGGELTAHQPALGGKPKAVARLMAKVARAVHHAHQHGILHRDLKPSNILLDADGEPHVSDFGLATRTDSVSDVTQTGAVIGTPQYMAPEQARGERRLTTAADVYALGGILYFLLAGRPPFAGRQMAEVVKRITSEPPPPPRDVVADVNRDLEAVCLKCLEKDPADRYRTAADLADDLERCERGESVSARPPALFEWVRRELYKTPQRYTGYVWQAKLWFAGSILAAQVAAVAAVLLNGPAWAVWLAFAVMWGGCGGALWAYKAAKFTRLPQTEQHAVMTAIGLILTHMALTAAYAPFSHTAADVLGMYPATYALTSLA
ncbi:MAG: serine/threonine protein kinase, partial [Fimbriiglobus sp.]|nr:serine/threonine protein kinase [Fimbriiglobus sp.]